jgi:hypothetical protein
MAEVDDILATIRRRESGNNYTIKSRSSSASGAYQFIDGTWSGLTKKFGVGTQYSSASLAPKEVQDTVAKLYVEDILKRSGGNINAVPNEWYTGNINGKMTAKQIAANGGLTSDTYTSKWLADYAKVTGGTITTDSNGDGIIVDENGNVIARAVDTPAAPTSGFAIYTGAEQVQLIQSMQDLENFESNWEENVLDQSNDYIYNLELFLVDREDVINFMNADANTIENDGWPSAGQKRVVVAKTGETAEFVITDLVVDSVSVGGISAQSSLIANAATELSFNITRVGNARLGDAIQDAVALAGYNDVSSAYFFIKIKFTHINENGAASSIANATKVLPFRLKKVVDISTSTDNRGTAATLEGTIVRKYALQTPTVGQIKYKISSDLVRTSADETITNFLTKLNEEILKNSHGVDSNYIVEYRYERDEHFRQRYDKLVIGDPSSFRSGTGGSNAETPANPQNNTISIATTTLEVQPTTNILDVIKDVMINTNEMRAALTVPNKTFSDLFSIEIDYEPKKNGYDILTRTEGAIVTFRACLKEELLEHNTKNQIDQLANINQTLQTMITSGRIKKKYYYYYTGKNDQIMQFDIVLNQQLIKAQNEEYSAYFDVNQVNSIDDTIENLEFYEKTELDKLKEDFSRAKQDVQNSEAALNSAKETYAATMQNLKNNFIDGVMSEIGVGHFEYAELRQIINNRFDTLDINSTNNDGYSSLVADLQAIESELGLLDNNGNGTILTQDVIQSLDALITTVAEAEKQFISARSKQSDMKTDTLQHIQDITGSKISNEWYRLGGGTAEKTFQTLGLASNIATLEDLETDIRRKLSSTEIAGILNFLSVSSARFISAELAEITGESTDTKLITNQDQKKAELARIKYIEGWSQDLSMVNATMKIKGDPYWIENYLSSKNRNSTYQRNNYRPNSSSTVVGTNFIMVISNTIEGTDNIDQPVVSNLFRYVYMVKSIKSEFSNGLFTQTLDMVRFTLAETYNYNPLTSETSNTSDPNSEKSLEELTTENPIDAGSSLSIFDLENIIEGNRTGQMFIANLPVGDILTDLQMKVVEFVIDRNVDILPDDVLQKYYKQVTERVNGGVI